MTEARLEEINKDGIAGIGMYANALTGKNIIQYTTVKILGHSPIIDGVEYSNLRKITDNKSLSTNNILEDRSDELIEYIISKRSFWIYS